jgi:hypothetical protein
MYEEVMRTVTSYKHFSITGIITAPTGTLPSVMVMLLAIIVDITVPFVDLKDQ